MSAIEVTYTGDQTCTALKPKISKRIAVDCPFTKGEEFGPDGLMAAGLGSCMLISMAGFADRHALDVTGARADVDLTFGGKPETFVTRAEVTIRVPRRFEAADQKALERAAHSCPIKHSLRPETEVAVLFEFGAEMPASAA